MARMKRFLKSFRFKVILAAISSLLFVLGLSAVLIHQYILHAQFEQLRDKLKVIASTASVAIDSQTLLSIPLNREGMKTSFYQDIAKKLNLIKSQNQPIDSIYILTRTDYEGIWQFIVDSDPEIKKKEGVTAYPGDKYNALRFSEMMKAFDGATADRKLEVDEWGVTLSGYAPILDDSGKAVAVLGVDILAFDIYAIQKVVQRRVALIFVLGLFLSFILGFMFTRHITGPIRDLVEGTRRISKGDLWSKVSVRDDGEIAELADAFNKMTEELIESQRKNHRYFYGVIQSLVRVVEAKDPYTRGHSERVAEYAGKIAVQMGFPADSVEALKQIAILHDIGKLSIQDNILNKKEKLTSEEWEVIRNHPAIGEDILKPVSLNQEMLTIVRGHHERYDGKGYPDALSGDQINIFAQIISVADAYDAMASSRAYRHALSQEEAVAELRKNRGTQFNPRVVDSLIDVLGSDQEGMA
ncbi:MAG: HD domain-containing protein [Candidatus Omnitrophica bacterium]|nr:HD domain-containing protein [Candidatus Omnitrophota bacterium]